MYLWMYTSELKNGMPSMGRTMGQGQSSGLMPSASTSDAEDQELLRTDIPEEDGHLQPEEARDLFRAGRMENAAQVVDALKGELGVDFATVRREMTERALHNQQPGRYWVLLTLPEAEALRAAMHAAAFAGAALGKGSKTGAESAACVGLRVLCPGVSHSSELDASAGYLPAPARLQAATDCCLRFFDSQMGFSEPEQEVLIEALHASALAERAAFFEGVRSCRRRSRQPWRASAVRPVLTITDHYALLARRGLVHRVARTMRARGLGAADLFRALDRQATGCLPRATLASGLQRLGLSLSESQ
eukprot:gene19350-23136_t